MEIQHNFYFVFAKKAGLNALSQKNIDSNKAVF